MTINTYHIYTDGSCLGNPGLAGSAFVDVLGTKILKSGSKHLGISTNNHAELVAIDLALDYLIVKNLSNNHRSIIYSDSQYAIDAITKYIHSWRKNGFKTARGKPVKHADLIRAIADKVDKISNLTFQHVAGHSGDFGNEAADRYANAAARQPVPFDNKPADPELPDRPFSSSLLFAYAEKFDKDPSGDKALLASMLRRAGNTLSFYEKRYGTIEDHARAQSPSEPQNTE